MPPDQTIRRAGSNAVTSTGKERFGLAAETTVILLPGAIVPSTRTTPFSHSRVVPGASTRIDQIASGLAAISALDS